MPPSSDPPLLTAHSLVAEWTPDDALLSSEALLARHAAMHSGGARARRLFSALKERVSAGSLNPLAQPPISLSHTSASGLHSLTPTARQVIQEHAQDWTVVHHPTIPSLVTIFTDTSALLYSFSLSDGADVSGVPTSSGQAALQLEASWEDDTVGWRKGVWSSDGLLLAITSSTGAVHILQMPDLSLLCSLPPRIPGLVSRKADLLDPSDLDTSASGPKGESGDGERVLDPPSALLFLPSPRFGEYTHLLAVIGYGDTLRAYYISASGAPPLQAPENGEGNGTVEPASLDVQMVRKRKRAASSANRPSQRTDTRGPASVDEDGSRSGRGEGTSTHLFAPAFRHRFAPYQSITVASLLPATEGQEADGVTGILVVGGPILQFAPGQGYASLNLPSPTEHVLSFWEILPASPFLREVPGLLSSLPHPLPILPPTGADHRAGLGGMFNVLRSKPHRSAADTRALSSLLLQVIPSPPDGTLACLDATGGISLWEGMNRVRTWPSAIVSYAARDPDYLSLSYEEWEELLEGSGIAKRSLKVLATHISWWVDGSDVRLLITYADGRYILTGLEELGNVRSYDTDTSVDGPAPTITLTPPTPRPPAASLRKRAFGVDLLSQPLPTPPDRIKGIYSLTPQSLGIGPPPLWILEVEERSLRVRVAGDKVTVGWRTEEGEGDGYAHALGAPQPRRGDLPALSQAIYASWFFLQRLWSTIVQWITSLVLWHWDRGNDKAARGTYWTVGRRRIRLGILRKQDALAAVEARLAVADWTGALQTAAKWGVSTDVVWEARWLDAPVTEDTVSGLLGQVEHDLVWVLDTCVARVAGGPSPQRALLSLGLQRMETAWEALAEGQEEERLTLVKYRLVLLRYLQRLDTFLAIKQALRDPESVGKPLEASEGDVRDIEDESFTVDFSRFRDVNIVAQAMEYAYQALFPALATLLHRHMEELGGFLYTILDQVPVTIPAASYIPLLAYGEGPSSGGRDDWIFQGDWVERVGWVEDGEDLGWAPFPITRESIPTDQASSRRSAWVIRRARRVEAESGDIFQARDVLHGLDQPSKEGDTMSSRLTHLAEWVYLWGKESLSLEAIESGTLGDVCDLLLAGVSAEDWMHRWDESLGPFLESELRAGGRDEVEISSTVIGVILALSRARDVTALEHLFTRLSGSVKKVEKPIGTSGEPSDHTPEPAVWRTLLLEIQWKILFLSSVYAEGCDQVSSSLWWGASAEMSEGHPEYYTWIRDAGMTDSHPDALFTYLSTISEEMINALGHILQIENIPVWRSLGRPSLRIVALARAGDRTSQSALLSHLISHHRDASTLRTHASSLLDRKFLHPGPPSPITTCVSSLLRRGQFVVVEEWLSEVRGGPGEEDVTHAILNVARESIDSIEGGVEEDGDRRVLTIADRCMSLLSSSNVEGVERESRLLVAIHTLRGWGLRVAGLRARGKLSGTEAIMERLFRSQPHRAMRSGMAEIEEVWRNLVYGIPHTGPGSLPHWRLRLQGIEARRISEDITGAVALLAETAREGWPTEGDASVAGFTPLLLPALRRLMETGVDKHVLSTYADEVDIPGAFQKMFGALLSAPRVPPADMDTLLTIYSEWERIGDAPHRPLLLSASIDGVINAPSLYGRGEKGEWVVHRGAEDTSAFHPPQPWEGVDMSQADLKLLESASHHLYSDILITLIELQDLQDLSLADHLLGTLSPPSFRDAITLFFYSLCSSASRADAGPGMSPLRQEYARVATERVTSLSETSLERGEVQYVEKSLLVFGERSEAPVVERFRKEAAYREEMTANWAADPSIALDGVKKDILLGMVERYTLNSLSLLQAHLLSLFTVDPAQVMASGRAVAEKAFIASLVGPSDAQEIWAAWYAGRAGEGTLFLELFRAGKQSGTLDGRLLAITLTIWSLGERPDEDSETKRVLDGLCARASALEQLQKIGQDTLDEWSVRDADALFAHVHASSIDAQETEHNPLRALITPRLNEQTVLFYSALLKTAASSIHLPWVDPAPGTVAGLSEAEAEEVAILWFVDKELEVASELAITLCRDMGRTDTEVPREIEEKLGAASTYYDLLTSSHLLPLVWRRVIIGGQALPLLARREIVESAEGAQVAGSSDQETSVFEVMFEHLNLIETLLEAGSPSEEAVRENAVWYRQLDRLLGRLVARQYGWADPEAAEDLVGSIQKLLTEWLSTTMTEQGTIISVIQVVRDQVPAVSVITAEGTLSASLLEALRWDHEDLTISWIKGTLSALDSADPTSGTDAGEAHPSLVSSFTQDLEDALVSEEAASTGAMALSPSIKLAVLSILEERKGKSQRKGASSVSSGETSDATSSADRGVAGELHSVWARSLIESVWNKEQSTRPMSTGEEQMTLWEGLVETTAAHPESGRGRNRRRLGTLTQLLNMWWPLPAPTTRETEEGEKAPSTGSSEDVLKAWIRVMEIAESLGEGMWSISVKWYLEDQGAWSEEVERQLLTALQSNPSITPAAYYRFSLLSTDSGAVASALLGLIEAVRGEGGVSRALLADRPLHLILAMRTFCLIEVKPSPLFQASLRSLLLLCPVTEESEVEMTTSSGEAIQLEEHQQQLGRLVVRTAVQLNAAELSTSALALGARYLGLPSRTGLMSWRGLEVRSAVMARCMELVELLGPVVERGVAPPPWLEQGLVREARWVESGIVSLVDQY